MNGKRWLAGALVCAMLCAMFLLVVDQAYAARGVGDLDRELGQRRGVSGALASTKKEDEGKGPTKFQMFLGLGSIFVMIAVVKWL